MFTRPFNLDATNGQQWSMDGMFRCIRYDEGAATGGALAKIRVMSITGSAYDMELIPGRMVELPELARGIVLQNISGAASIVGKITVGAGKVTDNSLIGTVSLDAATMAGLEEVSEKVEQPGAFYQSSTALAAAGNEVVFSAASNVSGAIVWSGEFGTRGGVMARYVAKAIAPANFTDGITICSANRFDYSTADNCAGQINRPIRIAAGLGLYYYSNHAEAAASRSVRYTLLP